MFEKTRAQLQKLEETNETFHKASVHLRENKKTYLVGAGCLATGLLLRKPTQVRTIVDAYKLQINSPTTNMVTTVLARRGHPGYIVKCRETGEMFASQGRAAQAFGFTPPALSQHLNGSRPHVGGLHFERIGEAL